MEKPAQQDKIQDYAWLKPTQFKKGQSGNPSGKPKGRKSMKTYLKERLERMPPKQKVEFLNKIDPEVAWKMAEGNPTNELKGDLDIKVSKLEEIQKATKEILK
jgi:hypothetical protein